MPAFSLAGGGTLSSPGGFTGPVAGLYTYAVLSGDTTAAYAIPGSALWSLGAPFGNVDFTGLPSGFSVVAASVAWSQTISKNFGTDGGASSNYDVTDFQGNVAHNVAGLSGLTATAVDLLDPIFSLRAQPGNFFGDKVVFRLDDLVVQGTFEIIGGSWTIESPTTVKIGDTVTITGTEKLDKVDKVQLTYDDPTTHTKKTKEILKINFITQTPTLIIFIFIIDDAGFEGSLAVFGHGDGTQFSGSVMAGTLHIYVDENVSGIYRLVAGKTNDTLYIASGIGPDTQDFKIPNPFVKTGFIGG